MTRLRRTLARRLRTLADHLDPPGVVTVRLEADTTALQEAMHRAARQAVSVAVNRTGKWEPVGMPPHLPARPPGDRE